MVILGFFEKDAKNNETKKTKLMFVQKNQNLLFFPCLVFSENLQNLQKLQFHDQNPFLAGSKYFVKLEIELVRMCFGQKINHYDLVVYDILKNS